VEIRHERAGDRAAVGALHLAAFGDHGDVVVRLVDKLRARLTPSTGLSLVATADDMILGHVLFTRSLLDAPARLVDVQVLSPVAVMPQRQRQGIGSALIRRGLETVAARKVPLVFLEGEPSYYSQLGFDAAAAQGFRKPSLRIPDAAFHVAKLEAYESWMTGTLVYTEPFWECDAVGLRDTPDAA
jgi:putative acetyltransferase